MEYRPALPFFFFRAFLNGQLDYGCKIDVNFISVKIFSSAKSISFALLPSVSPSIKTLREEKLLTKITRMIL